MLAKILLDEIPSFVVTVPFSPPLVKAAAAVIGFALVRGGVRLLRG